VPEPAPSRILLAKPTGSPPVAGAATSAPSEPPTPTTSPSSLQSGPAGSPQSEPAVSSASAQSPSPRPEDGAVAGGADVRRPDAPIAGSAPAPDIVIDLTATPSQRGVVHRAAARPARDVAGARHRRLLVVLATVAALTGVLAVTNFAIGMQWRSQALADQDRAVRAAAEAAARQQAVTQANAERDAAELRSSAMGRQLVVSEADVAALEARVTALANERAQAEDYGNYTAVGSRAQMRSLRTQVDSCVAQIAALRTSLLVEDPRATALQEMASAAEATCEQIGADVAVLAADE
jgi:hypothetical protein